MLITMSLYSDNSEQVLYNNPQVPIYSRKNRLSLYPNYAASSHWHDDLEFTQICKGHMNYNVNGEIIPLSSGSGIFVNSRQIHYGFSDCRAECEFIGVLLHPLLLCANPYLEQNFVTPVTANETLPYLVLQPDNPWQAEILTLIQAIYENEKKPNHTLTTIGYFYQIGALLYEYIPPAPKKPARTSHRLSSLKEMVGFIQQHYTEKLSLTDIALAGKVCKSSCSLIFQEYLHQSPMNYLADYRLDKSTELLRNTDLTVTEIAYMTGFGGASYYTETFRKCLLLTPTQYRKKTHANTDTSESL